MAEQHLFRDPNDRGADDFTPPLSKNGIPTLLGPDGRPVNHPEFGGDGQAIPRVIQFGAIIQSGFSVFFDRWDEARRHSRENSLAIEKDTFVQSLLQERIGATACLKAHLEVDDENDPYQKALKDGLQRAIMGNTPFLTRHHFEILRGVFWGRSAQQRIYEWKEVEVPAVNAMVPGKMGSAPGAAPAPATVSVTTERRRMLCVRKHQPVHGDSILHKFDGSPVILVYSPAANQLGGAETTMTTAGSRGVVIRGSWRDRFVFYSHESRPAEFWDYEKAEAAYGAGLRDIAYWSWWMKVEFLEWVTTYFERVGLGVNLWGYEAGNQASYQEVLNVANQNSRRVNILVPIFGTKKGLSVGGLERVETPIAGADAVRGLLEYFDKNMERYFVGQGMSAGMDKDTGLGGTGRAQFAANTKYTLIRYDADNLADCYSEEWVDVVKRWSYPDLPSDLPVRWRFNVPDPDAGEKLEAVVTLAPAGLTFKADEVRGLTGMSDPQEGDEVIGGAPQPGEGVPGGAPGGEPGAPGGPGGPQGAAGGANGQPGGQQPEEEEEGPQAAWGGLGAYALEQYAGVTNRYLGYEHVGKDAQGQDAGVLSYGPRVAVPLRESLSRGVVHNHQGGFGGGHALHYVTDPQGNVTLHRHRYADPNEAAGEGWRALAGEGDERQQQAQVTQKHRDAVARGNVFGRFHIHPEAMPFLKAIDEAHAEAAKGVTRGRFRTEQTGQGPFGASSHVVRPQVDAAPALTFSDWLIDHGHHNLAQRIQDQLANWKPLHHTTDAEGAEATRRTVQADYPGHRTRVVPVRELPYGGGGYRVEHADPKQPGHSPTVANILRWLTEEDPESYRYARPDQPVRYTRQDQPLLYDFMDFGEDKRVFDRDDMMRWILRVNPPDKITVGGMSVDDWKKRYLKDPEYVLCEVPTANLLEPDVHPDDKKVSRYAHLPQGTAPPIVVSSLGNSHWIVDGHHRFEAAKRRGDKTMLAFVPKQWATSIKGQCAPPKARDDTAPREPSHYALPPGPREDHHGHLDRAFADPDDEQHLWAWHQHLSDTGHVHLSRLVNHAILAGRASHQAREFMDHPLADDSDYGTFNYWLAGGRANVNAQKERYRQTQKLWDEARLHREMAQGQFLAGEDERLARRMWEYYAGHPANPDHDSAAAQVMTAIGLHPQVRRDEPPPAPRQFALEPGQRPGNVGAPAIKFEHHGHVHMPGLERNSGLSGDHLGVAQGMARAVAYHALTTGRHEFGLVRHSRPAGRNYQPVTMLVAGPEGGVSAHHGSFLEDDTDNQVMQRLVPGSRATTNLYRGSSVRNRQLSDIERHHLAQAHRAAEGTGRLFHQAHVDNNLRRLLPTLNEPGHWPIFRDALLDAGYDPDATNLAGTFYNKANRPGPMSLGQALRGDHGSSNSPLALRMSVVEALSRLPKVAHGQSMGYARGDPVLYAEPEVPGHDPRWTAEGITPELVRHYDERFREALRPAIAREQNPEVRASLQSLHDEGFQTAHGRRGFGGVLAGRVFRHGLQRDYEPTAVMAHLAGRVLDPINRYGKERRTPMGSFEFTSPEHPQAMVHTFLNSAVANIVAGEVPTLRRDYGTGPRAVSIGQGREEPGIAESQLEGRRPFEAAPGPAAPERPGVRRPLFYPMPAEEADSFAAFLEQEGPKLGMPLAEMFDHLSDGGQMADLKREYGEHAARQMRKEIDRLYEQHTGRTIEQVREAIRAGRGAGRVPHDRSQRGREELDAVDRGSVARAIIREHGKRNVPALVSRVLRSFGSRGRGGLNERPPLGENSPHASRAEEVLHQLVAEGLATLSPGPTSGLRVSPTDALHAVVRPPARGPGSVRHR